MTLVTDEDRAAHIADVRAAAARYTALANYYGPNMAAISLITGISPDEIHELGGVPDDHVGGADKEGKPPK